MVLSVACGTRGSPLFVISAMATTRRRIVLLKESVVSAIRPDILSVTARSLCGMCRVHQRLMSTVMMIMVMVMVMIMIMIMIMMSTLLLCLCLWRLRLTRWMLVLGVGGGGGVESVDPPQCSMSVLDVDVPASAGSCGHGCPGQ